MLPVPAACPFGFSVFSALLRVGDKTMFMFRMPTCHHIVTSKELCFTAVILNNHPVRIMMCVIAKGTKTSNIKRVNMLYLSDILSLTLKSHTCTGVVMLTAETEGTDRIIPEPVSTEDILDAIKQTKPTGKALAAKFETWHQEYGSSLS